MFVRFSLQIQLCWVLQGGCPCQGSITLVVLFALCHLVSFLLEWASLGERATLYLPYTNKVRGLFLKYSIDNCKNKLCFDAISTICPDICFKPEVFLKSEYLNS